MPQSKQKSTRGISELERAYWEAYGENIYGGTDPQPQQVAGHYGHWNNSGGSYYSDNTTDKWPEVDIRTYGGFATCAQLVPLVIGIQPAPQKAAGKTRGRWTMDVFEFVLIDTKTCKVLRSAYAIGKNESEALMKVVLSDTERALQEREMLTLLPLHIGSFERYVQKVEVVNFAD